MVDCRRRNRGEEFIATGQPCLYKERIDEIQLEKEEFQGVNPHTAWVPLFGLGLASFCLPSQAGTSDSSAEKSLFSWNIRLRRLGSSFLESSELNFEENDLHEEDCDTGLESGVSSSEFDGVPAIVGLEAIYIRSRIRCEYIFTLSGPLHGLSCMTCLI